MKLIFAVCLILVGCGRHAVKKVMSPDGKAGFSITCTEKSDCFQKASEKCALGYSVVDDTQDLRRKTDALTVIAAVAAADCKQNCSQPAPEYGTNHTMLVVCKDSNTVSQPVVSVKPQENNKGICSPGATQVCVGSGACRGGQVCQPDGARWGYCDCGQENNELQNRSSDVLVK